MAGQSKETRCTVCGKRFAARVEIEGHIVPCPACGKKFVVGFEVAPTVIVRSEPSPEVVEEPEWFDELPAPEPVRRKKKSREPAATVAPSFTVNVAGPKPRSWLMRLVVASVLLWVGCLFGEARNESRVREAQRELAAAQAEMARLSIVRGGGVTNSQMTSRVVDEPTNATAPTNPGPAVPSVPTAQSGALSLGDQYLGKGFVLTLESARIGVPKLISRISGDGGEGAEPQLMLQFRIRNTDSRRNLTYREANQFSEKTFFKMRDDVDNVVRGIDYGFSDAVAGALGRFAEIAPEEEATHVEVFSLPLPKTEYVTVTVELKCLGSDGEVRFLIPVSQITRQ